MSLPSMVRVRISSEGTEMQVTPVVSREMAIDELALVILGVTGKDPLRVSEILQRGTVISGASRLRWTGIAPEPTDVRELLSRFPDSDPSRQFDPARCTEIVLVEGLRRVCIDADVARKRRWFERRSFWDVLMQSVTKPVYRDYSYKESADQYVAVLSKEQSLEIQSGLRLLSSPIRSMQVQAIEFRVPRV